MAIWNEPTSVHPSFLIRSPTSSDAESSEALSPSSTSSSLPIAIGPSTSISSAAHAFSALAEEPVASTSALSLSSSSSFDSRTADGPLRELLPPLSGYTQSSSGGSSSLLELGSASKSFGSRSVGSAGHGFGSQRTRMASNSLSTYSSSPRSPLGYRSYLQNEDGTAVDRQQHRRRSAQFGPGTSASSATFFPYPSPHSPHATRPRRSSLSLSSSAASATPFGSLVGSYEQSLLAGRLSALPSKPLPFLAALGVLGSADSPPKLRCPAHLSAPFDAFFYEGPTSSIPSPGKPPGSSEGSPWVGTIDLDQIYRRQLTDPTTMHLPRFPGYRIPPVGQIQLVIRNHAPTSGHQALKLFLIPYDLRGLERAGQGGRTFLRQKSYAVDAEDGSAQGKLRYAVHLQFCSPPTVGKGKGKSRQTRESEPAYYLHALIRVVFGSKARDSKEEKLKVVAEGPEGIIDSDTAARRGEFTPYSGPGLEWDKTRRAAKLAKLEREERAADADDSQMELDEGAPPRLGMDSLGQALRGLSGEPVKIEFGRAKSAELDEMGRKLRARAIVPGGGAGARWVANGQGGLSISRPPSSQGSATD